MSAIVMALAIAYSVLTGGDGTVHEDNPFWDCATMGNHICGPTTREG